MFIKHELILPVRKKIWRAMGPMEIGAENHAARTAGLCRRAMLAVYATAFVLPIWEQHWPCKDPHHMLDLAQGYLRGEVDWGSAWKAMNKFSGGLDNTQGIPRGNFYSTYVGHASTATVLVALMDEWCDDDETLDEDRDVWDASFYACGAFAGELPWCEASDSKKRLQFWEWYIDEAVPRSYAQAA